MKDFQAKMVQGWKDFADGRIDAAALKGVTAGFGIYPQRNDRAMMRIRRPAGIVTTEDLLQVASMMTRHGADFAHIATRQTIQMHGVPPANVPAALEDCEAYGMYFRGGGGDTFRNTLVCDFSGLHADTAFDVIPYARRMSALFYSFDTAYGLPRKIKIGFADRAADTALAQVQDLGFVAKVVDGRRCFEVYFAGGIGFKPRTGIRLFDALPAEQCVQLAFALVRLFNDKGCRTNRAHARIRFLREDFGDEALVKMLLEYFEAAKKDAPLCSEDDLEDETYAITTFPAAAEPLPGFDTWRALAVRPLADGKVGVRIFVPFGTFTADELRAFADTMNGCGATRFQITSTQDLLVDLAEEQLAGFYNTLVTALGARDYTMKSFVGHVTTCVGSTICKSGVQDSPAFGKSLAEELDARLLPLDTPAKLDAAKRILSQVKICGCPNSCTNPPVADFGFVCKKSPAGEPQFVPFTSVQRNPLALGTMKPAEAKSVPDTAAQILAACGL